MTTSGKQSALYDSTLAVRQYAASLIQGVKTLMKTDKVMDGKHPNMDQFRLEIVVFVGIRIWRNHNSWAQ